MIQQCDFWEYIRRKSNQCLQEIYVLCFEEPAYHFPLMYQCMFLPTLYKGCIFSISLATLVFWLFDNSHPNKYDVVYTLPQFWFASTLYLAMLSIYSYTISFVGHLYVFFRKMSICVLCQLFYQVDLFFAVELYVFLRYFG